MAAVSVVQPADWTGNCGVGVEEKYVKRRWTRKYKRLLCSLNCDISVKLTATNECEREKKAGDFMLFFFFFKKIIVRFDLILVKSAGIGR